MTITIDQARLASITSLAHGKHDAPENGMCAMEAASYIAGEPFSDYPQCVCPVIAAFMRALNDNLPDDKRTALILPLLPRLVGTRADAGTELARAYIAADGAVRVFAPAALRACGLEADAEKLEALDPITDKDSALRARDAAYAAADAARAAAYAAAYAAADAAADAAYAAADAAYAAADAARAAAYAAYAADAAYAAYAAADAADAAAYAAAITNLVERMLAVVPAEAA